jgi:hypothetical protein
MYGSLVQEVSVSFAYYFPPMLVMFVSNEIRAQLMTKLWRIKFRGWDMPKSLERLRDVVEQAIQENELHVHEKGVDSDGDDFFDFLFVGERGNQYHTRLIIREEQVIVVTQLPLKVSLKEQHLCWEQLHKVNSTLAVGAFTTEGGYIAYRSGFYLSSHAEVTVKCVSMTLLSNVDIADKFLPTFLRFFK